MRLGLPSLSGFLLFQRIQLTTWIQIGEAIPPDHASPGVTVVSHMGVEVPEQNNGVPGRGTIQHPRQGRQEVQVLRTTARTIGQHDSQRPVPNPKAQGCDPLINWGKPQHKTTELGGNKQTHPSPLPLPVGCSRVEESRASFKRWVPEPTLCVEVVGPLGDGLAYLVRVWPGRVLRGATQPPGALRRVPTPGLAPGIKNLSGRSQAEESMEQQCYGPSSFLAVLGIEERPSRNSSSTLDLSWKMEVHPLPLKLSLDTLWRKLMSLTYIHTHKNHLQLH
ncbi:hypothetical protein CHARACLAT_007964 [Characodon lateralis]|uniref:Uncharacterized protein n=1 Tax=Characodon lateralis TaxID=208331 RepID=A0ABU7DEN3_9TELE|nr:hypothetical protein [Characodon lateralis]